MIAKTPSRTHIIRHHRVAAYGEEYAHPLLMVFLRILFAYAIEHKRKWKWNCAQNVAHRSGLTIRRDESKLKCVRNGNFRC